MYTVPPSVFWSTHKNLLMIILGTNWEDRR